MAYGGSSDEDDYPDYYEDDYRHVYDRDDDDRDDYEDDDRDDYEDDDRDDYEDDDRNDYEDDDRDDYEDDDDRDDYDCEDESEACRQRRTDRRPGYKPEISPSAIQRIIRRTMEEHNVKKEDIPSEGTFKPPDCPKTSKRYFEVRGFAWFTCPKHHWNPKLKRETIKRWPSAHSWCFVDLKTQQICYRDFQQCNKCNSKANPGPEFTEESVNKMAKFAVKGFLIRIGRLQYTPTNENADDETDGGPHDTVRCGKCKRLGRSCKN